jgi:hypothetical protein
VVTQIVEAEDPRAQAEVAVQGGQAGVDLVYQHPVNARVHLVLGQRGVERRGVLAHPRVEDVLLNGRGQRGGKTAFEGMQLTVEPGVGGDPVVAVRGRATLDVARRIDAQLGAVGQFDRGPRDLGVAQQVADGHARPAHPLRHAQDALGVRIQHVRPALFQTLEVTAVDRQARLFLHEGRDPLCGDRE